MPSLQKMSQTHGKSMPHTGQLIRAEMQRQHVKAADLARQLGVPSSAIPRYLQQSTIHAALLWKIGQVLHHNFFAAIAAEFPQPGTASPNEQLLQQQITDLQAQLADAQKENQVYQKVLAQLGAR